VRRSSHARPRTLAEALEVKARTEGSRWVAGGTDLLVRLKDGLRVPLLVSLRNVPALAEVRDDGALSVGAAAPLADVIAHPAVRKRAPLLADALAQIGSPQIRNVATIGGNLGNASPCADSAPALLVLEARARLAGPDGEREVPLADLLSGPGETCLGPHELVTALVIAPPPAGARGVFLKRRRVRMDLAQASVALLAEVEDGVCRRARVAAGAVAPVPLRLRSVEAALEGQRLEPDLLERAAALARDAVSPITDVRASADYRRHIVGVYVRRALEGVA